MASRLATTGAPASPHATTATATATATASRLRTNQDVPRRKRAGQTSSEQGKQDKHSLALAPSGRLAIARPAFAHDGATKRGGLERSQSAAPTHASASTTITAAWARPAKAGARQGKTFQDTALASQPPPATATATATTTTTTVKPRATHIRQVLLTLQSSFSWNVKVRLEG
ncbi:hypothetical protein BC831DRAFT_483883 [Entophlyctis helioformis]|nr:hypothetical protein BC831DRAFT_483883 [Entophlyctis helioformis]